MPFHPSFHITDALDKCADLLVRHGVTRRRRDSPSGTRICQRWLSRLKSIATDQLSNINLKPTVTADAEVSLVDIRPELFEKCLKYLEPTGYGNPHAAFVARNVKVKKFTHYCRGCETSKIIA